MVCALVDKNIYFNINNIKFLFFKVIFSEEQNITLSAITLTFNLTNTLR